MLGSNYRVRSTRDQRPHLTDEERAVGTYECA